MKLFMNYLYSFTSLKQSDLFTNNTDLVFGLNSLTGLSSWPKINVLFMFCRRKSVVHIWKDINQVSLTRSCEMLLM